MTDNRKLILSMRKLVDDARRKADSNLNHFDAGGSSYSKVQTLGEMLQGIGALADATLKLTIAEKVQREMDGVV